MSHLDHLSIENQPIIYPLCHTTQKLLQITKCQRCRNKIMFKAGKQPQKWRWRERERGKNMSITAWKLAKRKLSKDKSQQQQQYKMRKLFLQLGPWVLGVQNEIFLAEKKTLCPLLVLLLGHEVSRRLRRSLENIQPHEQGKSCSADKTKVILLWLTDWLWVLPKISDQTHHNFDANSPTQRQNQTIRKEKK